MKNLIFVFAFLISAPALAEITMTITKADGSTYWVQYFNTRAQGNEWLANEKLKPYWVQSYAATFTGADNVVKPVPTPDPSKVAARAARILQFQNAIANWDSLTVIQQKAVSKAIVEQLLDL